MPRMIMEWIIKCACKHYECFKFETSEESTRASVVGIGCSQNKHKEIIKTTGNAKRFELHMQPNVVGDAHCSTESSCLLEKMHSLFPKKQQL